MSNLQDILDQAVSSQYYVDGQVNLLKYADTNDNDQIKSIYSLIDESGDNLIKLIDNYSGKDIEANQNISINLGTELPDSALKNYSLITAKYNIEVRGAGLIAIIGPRSMPYSQLIGLLNVVRKELAQKIIDYYNRLNDS